jgi:hypothetical protein
MTARRHHFLPEAYLKGFAASVEQPQLCVFDLTEGRMFLASPDNIAVRRDFNRVNLPDVPIDDLEGSLGRIESDVIGALRRIHVARSLDVVEDLNLVLNLVGLIWCRNPRQREATDDAMARLAAQITRSCLASRERYEATLGRPRPDRPTPVPYEEMKAFVEGGGYKISATQNWHISLELPMAMEVIDVLARRKWALLRASSDSGGFVTCDHPVSLSWTTDVPGPPTLVSANTVVTFPLSSELCLLGQVGGESQVVDLDRQNVARLNLITICNAHRHVFASDDRFYFMAPSGESIQEGRSLLASAGGGAPTSASPAP